MNTTISNRQSRISQIVEEFDYQTVTKVVEALGRQSRFAPATDESLTDAIIRASVNLINETCDMYESNPTTMPMTNAVGGFQVTIMTREDKNKVSLSYVIDEMDTYN